MQVDPNIMALMNALLDAPGVLPFSSCGGHEEITTPSQCAAGEFYVSFELDIVRGGWRSLQLIAYAVSEGLEAEDAERVSIRVWTDGDPESIAIELRGEAGVSPDTVAAAIALSLEDFAAFDAGEDDDEGEHGSAAVEREPRTPGVSMTAFSLAWRKLNKAGVVDSLQSDDYTRVLNKWRSVGSPAGVEAFIREHANDDEE
jgi:hypothetical protein